MPIDFDHPMPALTYREQLLADRIQELEDTLKNSELIQYDRKETYLECPFCGCCAKTKEELNKRHSSICKLVKLNIYVVRDDRIWF